ncbi:vesicle transport v-SNARE protein VTI1, putative [Plasmodium knowlesi strain H]|uniref:Vesicle transport v-SNARE protein VTI1, putative n=3 Tax=Plasmodium knowlesi TaxID=5850 RepID=A0A5K1VEN8_PLAKH|nr:uncharacterized protein PKNH_1455700 [Plasmodium knowlesi strain H]OTN63973.1 putative Vesicle transport v-SNARE protein VTI1 [Plasmodium knowlesi]CAA9991153.1 vesicle transport v-SNARE protein VTI1, putative [Plasmodium knowlesi strain H]SBO27124.1 vesicle transport v-SNARE protein VTI1, putative [Plasmodium knowlesi strain H]SBO29361.1 vesicle transport v-SNARE protein VTI1, putative [Plasmodium knowlesi strain H]VVS80627.1 vesicle transport v-SNARE protein VTI1, putative [Plasmodium know|eukprot:XP_002262446.1 [Plasmodium knowlesi strain H]
MADTLYKDYKNNCREYIRTVSYTEKILQDNNSDKHKLLNIYEKAIRSAENMFQRMQLEVEANSLIGNQESELNELQREITEYKGKLNILKENYLAKEREKNERNNKYDDRVLLLSDVDILEEGDIYINQSKILLTNAEYISNDVLQNLNRQRDSIKKGLSNMPFIKDKLDQAKNLIHLIKKKQLLNKYRLYIIFIFIFLTFVFVTGVKYRRYVNNLNREHTQANGSPLPDFVDKTKEFKAPPTSTNALAAGKTEPDKQKSKSQNRNEPNVIVYDFIEKKKDNAQASGTMGSATQDGSATHKDTQTESSTTGGYTKKLSKDDKEMNQDGHVEKDQMEKEEPNQSEPPPPSVGE